VEYETKQYNAIKLATAVKCCIHLTQKSKPELSRVHTTNNYNNDASAGVLRVHGEAPPQECGKKSKKVQ